MFRNNKANSCDAKKREKEGEEDGMNVEGNNQIT
jgi:hypothetical protein